MPSSTASLAPAALPKLPRLDWRIPCWGDEGLTARPCPICGARNGAVLSRPDGLPAAYCASCALWYVASLPEAKRLEGFYQEYWGAFRESLPKARAATFMRWAARRNARRDLRVNRLAAILGSLRGQRVVDVGCGSGSFLLSLEAGGAQPFGVEISGAAREFVSRQLNIPVYADLSECLAERWQFGAIVLNDLVEHLDRPAEFLGTAVAALRPGGVLAIWTPNGGAAGRSLASAKDWMGFRVDLEHLQYFSAQTVLLLAEKLGLTVEHLETTGYPSLNVAGPRTCSPMGKITAKLWGALARRSRAVERTAGTYHLFAVLKKQ